MARKQQVIVIETGADADQCLATLGQLQRFLKEAESRADDEVDLIRTTLVEGTELQRAALRENEKALEAWAKKDAKTWAGRTLTLVWGWISWRTAPSKIVFDVEEATVIERLRARKMLTCIRTKEEVDKTALENYSDEIITAVGCTRKPGKDKFYYECKGEEVKP